MASGKFVLRLPIDVHASFQLEAKNRQISLNNLILEKLGHAQSKNSEVQLIQKVFGEHLSGIVQFGSTVRGEARGDSDIDLLLVMKESVAIDRSLYKIWDKQILPHIKEPYSPQFAHLPTNWEALSSLWLEVGLEGVTIFNKDNEVRSVISRIKSVIAAGIYQRRMSHGHPYWVNDSQKK